MNYPVWHLQFFGGGLLIAMMAVFHVYISHFAVGGGLFLVLTEMKGLREKSREVLDYGYRHTRFFLLITMVAGGITGVGIWFTIALLNPSATSVLIHNFVFAWAIEWVFFTIEIIALLIYYYTYGRMAAHHHLAIGWIYFGAAWMSLFIINGIIDFMLTPGDWLATHNFWDGFFNPTFWPALFFRTALCLIIAGLFGFMTATWIRDRDLRTSMVRYCALYLLVPFAVLLGAAWWYRTALPPELEQLIFAAMPEMRPFIQGLLLLSPLLIGGGLVLAIRLPSGVSRGMAVIMLLLGFLYMGSFEFIREGGRRPYILRDYLYSNSILKKELPTVRSQGVLQRAKWVPFKKVTAQNELAAGRELYNLLCLPCHAIGGPLNNIKELGGIFSAEGLARLLAGMDTTHPYMPPFPGTAREARALGRYIAESLDGYRQERTEVTLPSPGKAQVPPFDDKKSGYVLLAWSDQGMRSMSDSSGTWMMLPPGVTLHATLILRGETPEVITKGVTLHYAVDPAFGNPAGQVDFWQHSRKLLGTAIPANQGITGTPLNGTMRPEKNMFVARMLPLVPYTRDGAYMPYPALTITAKDSQGRLLARTRVVAPVATEMGCRNCHGGPWRVNNRAGISTRTAANVLAAHDRLSGTNLGKRAAAGNPVLCQECHADSKTGQPGKPGHLNLSAAIHGFHANFMGKEGAGACVSCHPADAAGATRAFRGIHHDLGLACSNCHGEFSDHALALLKGEQANGKQRAAILMRRLRPIAVASVAEIKPRQPWVNEPDCLNCHQEFEQPEEDTTFNQWTAGEQDLFRNRTEESGNLVCAACHNSPHAIYPTDNPYVQNLDNLQPLQYQGTPYPLGSEKSCRVCHTMTMDEEMHHPNMLREFRNP